MKNKHLIENEQIDVVITQSTQQLEEYINESGALKSYRKLASSIENFWEYKHDIELPNDHFQTAKNH